MVALPRLAPSSPRLSSLSWLTSLLVLVSVMTPFFVAVTDRLLASSTPSESWITRPAATTLTAAWEVRLDKRASPPDAMSMSPVSET